MQKQTFILLGTNLGNRVENLNQAKTLIENDLEKIEKQSSIYETAAWGKENQPSFYNQVIILKLDILPLEILKITQNIEQRMGRERKERWGERVIDIDILYYGNDIIKGKNLTIPHIQIQNRRFTLIPMVELEADFTHPVLEKTQKELLKICEDKLDVEKVF